MDEIKDYTPDALEWANGWSAYLRGDEESIESLARSFDGFAKEQLQAVTAKIEQVYQLLQNDTPSGAAAYLPAGGAECEELVDAALDILRTLRAP